MGFTIFTKPSGGYIVGWEREKRVETEWLIVAGMGGLFVLLGIGSVLWGRSEEASYYRAVSRRRDVREFLEHTPGQPQPQSLKTGGWIAIAVGLVMAAIAGGFMLWG
jgi:hypothetical protein